MMAVIILIIATFAGMGWGESRATESQFQGSDRHGGISGEPE